MTTIGISIDVEDVDHAADFYRDGLGLRLIERGRDWAKMALGEPTFFLGIPRDPTRVSSETIGDIGRRYISTSSWTISTSPLKRAIRAGAKPIGRSVRIAA
jgi:catechol 2,3-dioxygenase-like lactoylglutathione lyase family enzyme